MGKRQKGLLPPFEWQALEPRPVIGVDEVGRGCLAGPVVAAAVILRTECAETVEQITQFKDSKLLSASRRQKLAQIIHQTHQVAIAFASVEEIDRLNILQASLLAMARAVNKLGVDRGHVIVDGHMPIPRLPRFVQTTLVQGDQRAAPVSAASIVAKVYRDEWLTKLAEQYPGYGLEIHKGYGTQAHRDLLLQKGPSEIHRRSFKGVPSTLD